MASKPPAVAVTRPINPAGASPITAEQVWKALLVKGRNPLTFVAMFTGVTITNDKGTSYTRTCTTAAAPVVEDITEYAPAMAYYDGHNDGFRVTNVLSYGPEGELYLTFSFVNGFPGSPPASYEEQIKGAHRGLQAVIDRIRAMAEAGEV